MTAVLCLGEIAFDVDGDFPGDFCCCECFNDLGLLFVGDFLLGGDLT